MNTTRILSLTEEERARLVNGQHYDQFLTDGDISRSAMELIEAGEILDPVRPGIVSEYVTHGYGYLIQNTEDGFRFISVEAGEEDDFGPTLSSKREAATSARDHWHSYDGKDSDYRWSRELAKAAETPERVEIGALVELIAEEFASEVASKLDEDEISTLARKIAGYVNSL